MGVFDEPAEPDPALIGRAAATLAARSYDNVAIVRRFEALYDTLRRSTPTAVPTTRRLRPSRIRRTWRA